MCLVPANRSHLKIGPCIPYVLFSFSFFKPQASLHNLFSLCGWFQKRFQIRIYTKFHQQLTKIESKHKFWD